MPLIASDPSGCHTSPTMSALAVPAFTRPPYRHHRPAGQPAVQRCLRRPLAAVAGAVLVAGLVASCGSDDSPGATANQQSTTIADTTIPAAGQTARGTGYRFTLPADWRDTTTEVKKEFADAGQNDLAAQIDLTVAGATTAGFATNVSVLVQPSQGATLDDIVAAGRTQLAQTREDFLPVGQPEQLSLTGTPAMAHEYTYILNGVPIHSRQVVCLRGDSAYGVSFLAHSSVFTTDRAAFDQILASWAWE
jgi:DcrB